MISNPGDDKQLIPPRSTLSSLQTLISVAYLLCDVNLSNSFLVVCHIRLSLCRLPWKETSFDEVPE